MLHVKGAHNALSQSMLMGRGLWIIPANSYGPKIHATGTGHRRRGELVGMAPQVGGLFHSERKPSRLVELGSAQVGPRQNQIQEE